jgi:[ribosomal protein S5]-alanine N-acetyltransferase
MISPFPTLHTPRLRLRRFGEADLALVHRGLSDPVVIRHYGVRYGSQEETRAQMEWFAAIERECTGIWWAICSRDGREFYGAAGLNNHVRRHRKAEIGFWLLPEYWGRGIAAEALHPILETAFGPLQLHRVEAFVETANTRSARLLHRLGFRHEGTLAECEIVDQAYISLDIYAKLSTSS